HQHGARCRLRPARAVLPLRARIAAVARLSAAPAGPAAGAGADRGARPNPPAERHTRLCPPGPALPRAPGPPPGGPPGAGGGAGERDGRCRQGRGSGGGGPSLGEGHGGGGGFPGSVEPAPFGAASGYVQFISSQGAVTVPGGQGASPTRITLTSADRAIAR